MPYMGNQPATSFSSVSYQDLTGSNGTSFTLDYPVGNAQEIDVFVNNVRQEPGVAYTANGTELITTGSISISDDFYVVFSGKAQQSATHPANQDLDANNGTFTGTVTANSFIGIPNPSFIINGAMQVWQRGLTQTSTGYGCVDRWRNTVSGTTTFSQDTVSLPTGFEYALRWTTGASSSYGQSRQLFETSTVKILRDRTLTASAYVKVSGTYSGVVTWEIAYSTTSDIDSGNTWVQLTETNVVTASASDASSNYKRISCNVTIPSNAIGAYIGIVPSVAQASGEWVSVTGVKLEVGETVTDFIHEDIGTTLIKCQRYCRVYYGDNNYSQMGGTGFAANTTTVNIPVLLNPQMRAVPSLTASGNSQLSDGAAGTVIGGISVITQQSSKDVLSVAPTATGLTQHRPYRLESANNTTARITISAEL